jgi:glutamate-5-semialdehyde dehydrogenase
MAIKIIVNAKCQRPAVCNAIETLLVHKKCAKHFLPAVANALQARGVELRGCNETSKILTEIKAATEDDWRTEYLALILSIRIVPDLKEAIRHINHYGSHHSDAIITSSNNAAKQFCKEVDSAAVYVNASTRFTDGGEFGMGAEIGISTDKLHARGPMGLEELTSYKYIVHGAGQIRE